MLRNQRELDDFLSRRPGAVPLLRGGPFVVRGNVAVEAVGESEVALEGGTATLYEQARAEVWGGKVEAWDDAVVSVRRGYAAITDRVSLVVKATTGPAPIVIAAGEARVAAYGPAWIRLHQRACLVYAAPGSIVELGRHACLDEIQPGCIVMAMNEPGPLDEELKTLAAVRALLFLTRP